MQYATHFHMERIWGMSIRSAAKAIILQNNEVLLNRCHSEALGDYYTLPGGGQHQYETMEEGVVRECMEETGYTVVPEAFIALYEEIHTSETLRKEYPEYTHRIFHIFRCTLADAPRRAPTETDVWQSDSVWVDADTISGLPLMPVHIRENIQTLIHTQSPVYLGSHLIELKDNA